jgi:hypothetical protein
VDQAPIYLYSILFPRSELNNNYAVDPVERIILAEACCLPEWKEPAFVDLVRREEFIRYEEVIKLGPKSSHALYVARKEARKNAASACHRCQGSSTEEPTLHNDPTSSDLTIHNDPPHSHPTPQDGPSSLDPILHENPSRSARTSFDDPILLGIQTCLCGEPPPKRSG